MIHESVTCDRCQAPIQFESTIISIIQTPDPPPLADLKRIDLCRACSEKLMNLLRPIKTTLTHKKGKR